MATSQDGIRKIEELVRSAEGLSDPKARSLCADLVQAVLGFHAAGLERMLEIILQTENGPSLLSYFAGDELTANLLLLHGLHPESLETRIDRALEKLRPFLQSRGIGLSVVSVENGAVRLKLTGGNRLSLKEKIEDAIIEAGPEVVEVTIDGAGAMEPQSASAFVPLTSLLAG